MVWTEPYIYFGTAELSRKILAGLVYNELSPALVVSTHPKPAGRGLKPATSPVADFAVATSLPLVLVKSFKSGLPEELRSVKAKFAILASFGKIVPQALLDMYEHGIVNIHPSLLPRYRGASPIQGAILDDAKETGITLIRLDDEVDHGPIIAQASLPIGADDALELETRLAELALDVLLVHLPPYLAGELQPVEQKHSQATFTQKIKREDGRADFNQSAEIMDRRRRAYTPWPGLWTTWHGKRLKLALTSVLEGASLSAGSVGQIGDKIAIGCASNSALVLEAVQLAGGKLQPTEVFLRGHREFVGSRLPS